MYDCPQMADTPNHNSEIVLESQPGRQEQFLGCDADVAIFGGSSGGGKSHGLLLQPLAGLEDPGFNGVIFRRLYPQIMAPGGLWDKSQLIYRPIGAVPANQKWTKDKWQLQFSHMQHVDDRMSWDGSELDFIGFDELQHFEEVQFFYMLGRLRSVHGIKPYLRATCNPAPGTWLARLLQWWWDPETGLAIPERSGVIRWFVRDGDEMIWGDSAEELLAKNTQCKPMSFTFIRSTVHDNKILLTKDPGYLTKLDALPRIERDRLRDGNWKLKAAAGNFFKRTDFEIVDAIPSDVTRRVRYWDLASTKKAKQDQEVEGGETSGPAFTAGLKMSRSDKSVYYIEHVSRFRENPSGVEKNIKNTASHDGIETPIVIEGDPGQAARFQISYFVRELSGYTVSGNFVRDSKGDRAKPVSSQAQAGNIKLLRGSWNDAFLNEVERFDPLDDDCKKDQVDAMSGAFSMLSAHTVRQFKVWSIK